VTTADDLIEAIADQLDPSQRDRIRAECERMKEEFQVLFEDEIGATEKRDRLLEVEKACRRAAIAVAQAPQDDEWLPRAKLTLANDHWLELNRGGTEIATLLAVVADAAAVAAGKLALPKAKAVPKKDATAAYAYILVTEFSIDKSSTSVGGMYFTVATLLFEYLIGIPDANLESSCRKVLKRYRRGQSSGSTAP